MNFVKPNAWIGGMCMTDGFKEKICVSFMHA